MSDTTGASPRCQKCDEWPETFTVNVDGHVFCPTCGVQRVVDQARTDGLKDALELARKGGTARAVADLIAERIALRDGNTWPPIK